MKRTLPLVITFIIGMLMVGEYFVPHWRYHRVTSDILQWGALVASAAFVLGLINLVQVNWPIIRERQPDWGYKLVLVISMLASLVAGLAGGEDRQEFPPFRFFFQYVFSPLDATMFSLLGFYIASAAFRAFRARNVEAALLLIAAVIVMLGRVPVGTALSVAIFDYDYLGRVMNWIMDVPNNAGRRALLIGAALGAIATGLRIILGIERSHLGGDS